MNGPRALYVIVNPHARALRRGRVRFAELQELCKEPGPYRHVEVMRTASLDDLRARFARCDPRQQTTLAFVGGDGTLARGLSTWFSLHPPQRDGLASATSSRGTQTERVDTASTIARSKTHPRPDAHDDACLPPANPMLTVLPLCGGTMNYVAAAFGHKEAPVAALARHLGASAHASRVHALLRVSPAASAAASVARTVDMQLGFFFAWGVGCRVLERLYRGTAAPNGWRSAREMCLATARAAGEAWQAPEQRQLLRSATVAMEVDGRSLAPPQAYSLVCSTLSRVCMDLQPFEKDARGDMLRLAACDMAPRHLLPALPRLLFGAGDKTKLQGLGATFCHGFEQLRFQADEAFTIEGEVYRLEQPTTLELTRGPRVRMLLPLL